MLKCVDTVILCSWVAIPVDIVLWNGDIGDNSLESYQLLWNQKGVMWAFRGLMLYIRCILCVIGLVYAWIRDICVRVLMLEH